MLQRLPGIGVLHLSRAVQAMKWGSLAFAGSLAAAAWCKFQGMLLVHRPGSCMLTCSLDLISVVQGMSFEIVHAALTTVVIGASPRTRTLSRIHLDCQLCEVQTPSGWEVQALVTAGQIRLTWWLWKRFEVSLRGAASLSRLAVSPASRSAAQDFDPGKHELTMARFVDGWDDTLLAWADQAQASPDKALVWTSRRGLEQSMPAWRAVREDQRLLLQVLAGGQPERIPLAALSSALSGIALASGRQRVLIEHELNNTREPVWRTVMLLYKEGCCVHASTGQIGLLAACRLQ